MPIDVDIEDLLEEEEEQEEENEDEEVVDRGDIVTPEDQDEEEYDDDDLEDDEEPEEDEDEPAEDDEDEELEEDDSGDDEDVSDSDEEEEDADEPRIPKGRLDQVLRQRDEEREKRQWLEDQFEALLATQKAPKEVAEEEVDPGPPDFDFDEAEEQYLELVLEGDIKKASQLKSAINDARNEVFNYQIESARRTIKSEAVSETATNMDNARFKSLISELEEKYPILNSNSDEYNEKAVTLANRLMVPYIQEGETKSQALLLAVKEVLELMPSATPGAKETGSKTTVRKKQARRKAAKASKQQPPATSGAKGKASRKISPDDIKGMSDKQFRGLTERERAKLRGDIL